MNDLVTIPPPPRRKRRSTITTSEYKLVPLHDALPPGQMAMGDTPERIAAYWRAHVETSPTFSPTVENAVLILLNTRRRITGHRHLSTGTIDTCYVSPAEIFRTALLHGPGAGIVIGHNHPGGESWPSDSDIKITRDLFRAAQLLKIALLDHLIIAHPAEGKGYASLRELGYLA
jgi:DNA repair protein RadC